MYPSDDLLVQLAHQNGSVQGSNCITFNQFITKNNCIIVNEVLLLMVILSCTLLFNLLKRL